MIAVRNDGARIGGGFEKMMYLYVCERTGGATGRQNSEGLLQAALRAYSARAGLDLPAAPDGVPIERDVYGKPRFAGLPQVHFSLSHSGRLWACLMGDRAVGLDLEDMTLHRFRRRGAERAAGHLAIARRFFAADEWAFVEAGGDGDAGRVRFFSVWTRKEAYVKYTGRGLGAGLSGFSVLDGRLDVCFGVPLSGPGIRSACCSAEAISVADTIFL
jgi:4'-phosphopantetheinyl transferase